MKKLIVLICLVSIIFVSFTLPSFGAAKTDVRFTLVCGVEEEPGWKAMVEAFNKQSTDTNVIFERLPGGWREYTQKMQTLVAAGNPPDIGRMSPAYTPGFEKAGSLVDLYPFITKEKFPLNDYYEAAWKPYLKGNHMYAFPAGIYTMAMYYNKDMFAKAGIARPKDTWTQRDMLVIAQKLTKGSGPTKQFGIYVDFNLERCLQYFWQNGADFMDPEMTKCTMDTPEAIETLQFLRDLVWKYRVAPTPTDTQVMSASDMFMTGRLGMLAEGQWMIPAFKDIKNFSWGVLPYPRGKKGRATMIWADPYVIYTGSKNPEAAWKVIKFFVNEGANALVDHGLMGTPVNKKIAQSRAKDLYEPLSQEDKQVWWNTLEYARSVIIPPNWEEIRDTAYKSLELLALNKISVEEAVKRICEDTNRLLKEVKGK